MIRHSGPAVIRTTRLDDAGQPSGETVSWRASNVTFDFAPVVEAAEQLTHSIKTFSQTVTLTFEMTRELFVALILPAIVDYAVACMGVARSDIWKAGQDAKGSFVRLHNWRRIHLLPPDWG